MLAGFHSDGKPFTITVTPDLRRRARCLIGVGVAPRIVHGAVGGHRRRELPVRRHRRASFRASTRSITGQVKGGLLGPQGLTGPIGIAAITVRVASSQGPPTYIFLVALLSVALGFTNLLPLLALDGGRIVVVVIEWLRRRPFDRNSELNIQRWGLVALLAPGRGDQLPRHPAHRHRPVHRESTDGHADVSRSRSTWAAS